MGLAYPALTGGCSSYACPLATGNSNSRWSSANTPFDPFGNGIYGGDPYSPETFVTTQGVMGVTWLPTPTLVLDVRASYGRWMHSNHLISHPTAVAGASTNQVLAGQGT